jgi:hypothetical protein
MISIEKTESNNQNPSKEQKYQFHKHNFQKFESESLNSPSQPKQKLFTQLKGLSRIKTSPLYSHLQNTTSSTQDHSNDTDRSDQGLEKFKSSNTKKPVRDAESKNANRTKSQSKTKRDAIANNKTVMKIINDSLNTDSSVCDVLWLPAIKFKSSSRNQDLRFACVGSMDILSPSYKNTSYSTTSESYEKADREQEQTKQKMKKDSTKTEQLNQINEANSSEKVDIIVPPKRLKLSLKKENSSESKSAEIKPEAPKRKSIRSSVKFNSGENIHLKNIISQAGDLTPLILPIIKLSGLSGGVTGEKYQNLINTYNDVKEKSKIHNNSSSKNRESLSKMTEIKSVISKPTEPPPQPPPRYHSLPRKKSSETPQSPGNTNTLQSKAKRNTDTHSHNESTRTAKSSVSSEPNQIKLESFKNEIDKTMNDLTKFQHEVTNRIKNNSTSSTLVHSANKMQFDTGVNTDISMCNAVFTIKYDNGSNLDTSTSSLRSSQQKASESVAQRLSTPSVMSTQSLPYATPTTVNAKSAHTSDTSVITADTLRKRLENEINKTLDTPIEVLRVDNFDDTKSPLTPRTSQATPSTKEDDTIILSFIPLKRQSNQSRHSLPVSDCYKSNTSIDSSVYKITNTSMPRLLSKNECPTKQPIVKIRDCRFSRTNNSYQTYPIKTSTKPKTVKGTSSFKPKMTTINYVTFDELDKKIYRYSDRPKSSIDTFGNKNENVIDEPMLPPLKKPSGKQKSKVYNLKYYLNGIHSQYGSWNRNGYKIRYPLDEIEEQIEELLVNNKSNERLNSLRVKYMKNKSDEHLINPNVKPVRFIYKVGDTDDEDYCTDSKTKNNESIQSLLTKSSKLFGSSKTKHFKDFDRKLIEIN